MRTLLIYLVLICVILGCHKKEKKTPSNLKNEDGRIIKVIIGIDSDKISDEWDAVLVSRKSISELDFGQLSYCISIRNKEGLLNELSFPFPTLR